MIYDLKEPTKPPFTLRIHTYSINKMIFNKKEDLLISFGDNSQIQLHNL